MKGQFCYELNVFGYKLRAQIRYTRIGYRISDMMMLLF